jgi:hypothetical protein
MDFLKKKMKELLDDDPKPEKKAEGKCRRPPNRSRF